MEKMIIDFSSPDEHNMWEVINDGVMGGVSESRVIITENKTALFQGVVSLENYGGFASMRSYTRKFKLAGFKGLMAQVKGDGKSYQLRLRVDDAYDGIAYQAHFLTEQAKWIIVRLSFDSFTPVFRGRIIKDAPELDVSRIGRIGFMIAGKQAGPFRLEIGWVKAYV